MCQGLRFAQPESRLPWLWFQPSLKFSQLELQIPNLIFSFFCEPTAWELLWKLPKRCSGFHTYFSICWLPLAFHYQSVVSLQFRKKPHPIPLLLYFSSSPPCHTHTFQVPESSYWPLHFPLLIHPGSLPTNILSISLPPCSRAVCALTATRNCFLITSQGVNEWPSSYTHLTICFLGPLLTLMVTDWIP